MIRDHYPHLLPDHVHDLVHQLSSLGVETLCPVVTSPALGHFVTSVHYSALLMYDLSEHEVVWSEHPAHAARPHRVHGAGLQVRQHRAGNLKKS